MSSASHSILRTALSRISSYFTPKSTLAGRELQLRIDTAQLYLSIPARLRLPLHEHPETPEQAHVAAILNVEALPAFQEQANIVTAYLTAASQKQLIALSSAIRSKSSVDRYIRSQFGFVAGMGDSSVPDAGRGIYVHGSAPRGSLLTLYPGVSYLPSHVRQLGHNVGNDYWISRFDGVVIDGASQVELQVDIDADQEQELVHPLALGHIVNHPPKGKEANCLQFMLDIDIGRLPHGARELVPNASFEGETSTLERIENRAYQQRVPGSAHFLSKARHVHRIKRTLALVATRDINDEEIFMNYRFNPNSRGLPEWYHDCDPETSSRRWNSAGIFS